jgi:hypothetical protein
MPAILRTLVGGVQTLTAANSIGNNAYANVADKFTVDNTGLALLADFALTLVFATAPVLGSVQLFAVDWSLDATPVTGPTPSATVQPRFVGSFSPTPLAANALTSWVMRLNSVPVTAKTDFYVLNNATGQTINTSWVLKTQLWSPG